MECCGEREKLEDARAEQKWSYIVWIPPSTVMALLIHSVEPQRLQIHLLSIPTFLWRSLPLPPRLRSCLRRGLLYGRQFTLLQPLVRSGQACHQLQDSKVDLCCLYPVVVGASRIPMDSCNTRHQKWHRRRKLSGPASGASTEHPTWPKGARLAKVPRLHSSYRRPQRC